MPNTKVTKIKTLFKINSFTVVYKRDCIMRLYNTAISGVNIGIEVTDNSNNILDL